ncbi:type 4 prepilin peptidase 1 Aspartic peptidase. MEROPS family A24A [Sphingomonas laterariae]|uniref:Prepilin leader peptidase/N-methyltransferase n=1 Tax=Edaphosphingomonas laterariae TaxID=861865 RepID=A0A239JD06_9SPHN|nr:A24 family peptidase [Sphingomonas laterariae]SNT03926.1 type 4 prepilin peptidase 1 Aspartic peptidase. MEROPS family A24A [Sphingomonas laterariae]
MAPEPLFAVAGFVLGAIFGSFLATIAIRWPDGRSVLSGRSACDSCGSALGAVDLVPLAGYVLRRGRCAGCGAAIDIRHPAIELACAAIGAVSLWVAPGMAGAFGAAFGWLLVTLAVLDAEHFWLPNPLVGALALIGLAGGIADVGVDLPARLFGGLAGFVVLSAVAIGYRWIRGRVGMGGGDPKLLGAIGLTLGWQAVPLVLFGGALAGLVLIAMRWLRGDAVRGDQQLPFGTLMAVVAWPLWLVVTMA